MCPLATLPVYGITNSSSDRKVSKTTFPEVKSPCRNLNLVDSLLSNYTRNERLLNELKSLRQKLNRARAYIESPSCNRPFALANLDRLKLKHGAALTLLRASRIESQRLLERMETEAIHD